ncbi:MAG: hypothetical protein EP343_00330 [Deltaproteobacteria bacterium]|nr:MAG: hypothetical protein EP343_00330 [Deltaproteobacteria bacterium]
MRFVFLTIGLCLTGMVWGWSCRPYAPVQPPSVTPPPIVTHPTKFGMPRWVFPRRSGLRFPEVIIAAPVANQNHVYVLTSDSYVYAIDYKGDVSWRWPPESMKNKPTQIRMQPVLSPDGQILFLGTERNYMYALNTAGQPIWKEGTWLPGSLSVTPLVTDKYIYASMQGTIKVLDYAGKAQWSYATTSRPTFSTTARALDGTLYITDSNGYLHVLSDRLLPGLSKSQECRNITRYNTLGQAPRYCLRKKYCANITTPPTLHPNHNTVYFGCQNGKVFAINPKLEEQWTFQSKGPILAQPMTNVDGSTLYVSSDDKNLYALQTSDGEESWTFKSGHYKQDQEGKFSEEPVESSVMYIKAPVTLDSIRRLYVGSINHYTHVLTPKGKLIWQYKLDGWMEYAPRYVYNSSIRRGTLFVVTARRLYAFNF